MTAHDTLTLTGLQFFGLHGTEPWEKEVGRRFIVDVELTMELETCGRSDRLEDALDYRLIYAAAKDVVQGESHKLIERVAWRVLEEMFARFAQVSAVKVRVHKPEAPIGGLNQAVIAEITRTRESMRGSK